MGSSTKNSPPPIDERNPNVNSTAPRTHPFFDINGSAPGQYDYLVERDDEGNIINEPTQAWGDYELIQVGDTFYLFADDDRDGEGIGLGYWYSDDLNGEFTYGGVIADGFHPDPGVFFAEEQFVAFVQSNGGDDLTSSGPWVAGVEAQAGVDVDGDGVADVWTDWQEVSETYSHTEGFTKIFGVDPASLDLEGLPSGFGFQFRVRTGDAAAVLDTIVIDSIDFIPGDFNADGIVDQEDFAVWTEQFGSTAPIADDNGDSLVNAADFVLFRDNFSASVASAASVQAVPEPAGGMLGLLAIRLVLCA